MYCNVFKHIIDFTIALLLLPILLIAIMILAPIICLSDHGPLFYNGKRVGKMGRVFKMFKFRSMKVNAPDIRLEDGSTYNSADDQRVTKIGRLMRNTSIDELPQILNVLRGDMSLVGPRPNLPTTQYEKLDPAQQHRLLVKPGITGYSQAYFRNSIDADTKTKNDNYYVDNISFLLDMKILFKTFCSVFSQKNIYSVKNSSARHTTTQSSEKSTL